MPEHLNRDEVLAIIQMQARKIASWDSERFPLLLTDEEADKLAVEFAERLLTWCKFLPEAPHG